MQLLESTDARIQDMLAEWELCLWGLRKYRVDMLLVVRDSEMMSVQYSSNQCLHENRADSDRQVCVAPDTNETVWVRCLSRPSGVSLVRRHLNINDPYRLAAIISDSGSLPI